MHHLQEDAVKRTRRADPKYARLGGVKWHVTSDNLGLPFVGACATHLHGEEVLAKDVPLDERCRSPRCGAQWPASLRIVG